jgi:hypothetical protein
MDLFHDHISDFRNGDKAVFLIKVASYSFDCTAHNCIKKNPLFYNLAKYDHETRSHNCYNIANYEKQELSLKIPVAMVTKRF